MGDTQALDFYAEVWYLGASLQVIGQHYRAVLSKHQDVPSVECGGINRRGAVYHGINMLCTIDGERKEAWEIGSHSPLEVRIIQCRIIALHRSWGVLAEGSKCNTNTPPIGTQQVAFGPNDSHQHMRTDRTLGWEHLNTQDVADLYRVSPND
eukprot:gene16644-biopygen4696